MSSAKWRPFFLGLNVLTHVSKKGLLVYVTDTEQFYDCPRASVAILRIPGLM